MAKTRREAKGGSATQPSGKTVSGLSPRKRRIFIAAAICFPLVLVLGTELGLRVAGFGGYPATLRKVMSIDGRDLVITDHEGPVSYFFANKERPGYNDQYSFFSPKPANTFRIFMVGESAMKGYPQPRNLASSAFLQAMLQDAWPDRRVEIINLGTTAVASYPVLGIMTEALEFEPDLVIVHTGHNEFFGTYGVASAGQAGAHPWMLKFTRFYHSLALVQGAAKWRKTPGPGDRTLMETMVGRQYVGPNDPRRKAAARNLHHNISAMIRRCANRNVPVIVCTLPSNESELWPVGRSASGDSAATAAREYFLRAKALVAEGKIEDARTHFIQARDADTMPWRATSAAQEAIRRAAREQGAVVCDLESAFRRGSTGAGGIGWDLMDDHVHPTLRGQALMAETFVETLTTLEGRQKVGATERARIGPWDEYARRLGENPYDRYGVAHNMRLLFSVPFMRQSNPDAFERFNTICLDFERAASAEMLEVIREWQSFRPHAGAKRPLSGMVARVLMRQRNFPEALRYYEFARNAVPEYTSWHMEYVYFALVAKEKMQGKLTEADRAMALREIQQGHVLLRQGFSETGFAERYLGRLHQLRGEFAEAIPFLQASRRKLSGMDYVAADQALVVSYLQTRQFDKAYAILNDGVTNSGQYIPMYQKMLTEFRELERTVAASPSNSVQPTP
jgi:tetratricopeptide (TPR) repeat protein